MSMKKKAARLSANDLDASIAAATAGAKARIAKLDAETLDRVAGGIDIGGDTGGDGGDDGGLGGSGDPGTTAGAIMPNPFEIGKIKF